jgi:hypothetical protein
VVVPIGTSEYHTIDGFCKNLAKPNQLVKRSHLLESIHLSPRVFCNSACLGEPITLSMDDERQEDAWATIEFLNGSQTQILTIGTQRHEPIEAIEYWLNLEDIYPSSTGPLSHGLDIVRRALEKLGVVSNSVNTFQARLEMNADLSLETKEVAVLERLLKGHPDIISNTLVGSLQVIKHLLEKKCIVFVPDFNHLGIEPDFVIYGPYDDMKRISESTLESTILKSNSNAYAIVSAPTSWRKPLLESAFNSALDIWPILSIKSERRLLRHEKLFVEGKKLQRWSDGTS